MRLPRSLRLEFSAIVDIRRAVLPTVCAAEVPALSKPVQAAGEWLGTGGTFLLLGDPGIESRKLIE